MDTPTAIIAAIVTGTLSIITAMMPYLFARLTQLRNTGEATHALVNSRMTTQLYLTASALRRVATLTPGDPIAERDARLAERLLAEAEGRTSDPAGSAFGLPPR